MLSSWAQFKIYFNIPFLVKITWVNLTLDRTPGRFMNRAFAALIVGADFEKPDAFNLKGITLKILYFPLFSRMETTPKLFFALLTVAAIKWHFF